MKKILFLIAITAMLTSCFNKNDYAYNEKMASLFYQVKEKLDDSFLSLQNGDYAIDKENEIHYDMILNRAQQMATYINGIKDTANELQPSENAKPFHQETIKYMTLIADEYAPLLVKYVTEQNSTARISIQEEITSKKKALEAQEDKCLEIQLEFLNKAGLQPKE